MSRTHVAGNRDRGPRCHLLAVASVMFVLRVCAGWSWGAEQATTPPSTLPEANREIATLKKKLADSETRVRELEAKLARQEQPGGADQGAQSASVLELPPAYRIDLVGRVDKTPQKLSHPVPGGTQIRIDGSRGPIAAPGFSLVPEGDNTAIKIMRVGEGSDDIHVATVGVKDECLFWVWMEATPTLHAELRKWCRFCMFQVIGNGQVLMRYQSPPQDLKVRIGTTLLSRRLEVRNAKLETEKVPSGWEAEQDTDGNRIQWTSEAGKLVLQLVQGDLRSQFEPVGMTEVTQINKEIAKLEEQRLRLINKLRGVPPVRGNRYASPANRPLLPSEMQETEQQIEKIDIQVSDLKRERQTKIAESKRAPSGLDQGRVLIVLDNGVSAYKVQFITSGQ